MIVINFVQTLAKLNPVTPKTILNTVKTLIFFAKPQRQRQAKAEPIQEKQITYLIGMRSDKYPRSNNPGIEAMFINESKSTPSLDDRPKSPAKADTCKYSTVSIDIKAESLKIRLLTR